MFKMKHRLLEAAPAGASPAAQPSAGGAPPAGTPNGQPAANQAWFPDAHKSFVETKGWKAPSDVLESYVNLEKLIGADRAGRTVVLPKDENDADGMKAYRAKIGVPEKAEAYELPVPEGDDGKFAGVVSGWMLEAGVPKREAQALTKKWNEHMNGLVQQAEQLAQQKSEQELGELKSKWGNDFAQNEEHARRGFRQFGQQAGLDDSDMKALEQSVGTAKMLKLFVELGKANAEPGFAGNSGGGMGGMSKVNAQSKLNEINAKRASGEITDKQWNDTYQAEVEKLAQIAYTS